MQGVDGGGFLVTSDARERVDGNERVVAESGAWSSSLISSSSEGRERLEVVCASKCLVRARFAQIAAENNKGRHQGSAPGREERGMTGGRRRGHHIASDLTIYDASTAALRRGISPAWRLLWLGERRGKREGR
jgi:hypothetical protein